MELGSQFSISDLGSQSSSHAFSGEKAWPREASVPRGASALRVSLLDSGLLRVCARSVSAQLVGNEYLVEHSMDHSPTLHCVVSLTLTSSLHYCLCCRFCQRAHKHSYVFREKYISRHA